MKFWNRPVFTFKLREQTQELSQRSVIDYPNTVILLMCRCKYTDIKCKLTPENINSHTKNVMRLYSVFEENKSHQRSGKTTG